MTITVKLAISGFVLAALCLLGAGSAEAQTPVRYNNGWLFGGGEAYGPLAQDRGCFARERLDVTMDRGFGSGDTVSKIAGGAYDIGEADFNTMSQFTATHPDTPVIAIFMIGDRTAASVVALKSSGITKPQDLVGKRIGDAIGETSRVLFPAFAAANNLDPNAVTWVNTAVNIREQLLVQKRADLVAGHLFTLQSGLRLLGVKEDEITALRYADWGVNLFGAALVAKPSWAAAHAEATRSFVRCMAEAIKLQFADPQAALAAASARNSMLEPNVELDNLKFLSTLVLTENTRKNGLSSVGRERLERSLKQLAGALEIPLPKADQVWTAEYLPPADVLKLD